MDRRHGKLSNIEKIKNFSNFSGPKSIEIIMTDMTC